MLIKDSLDILSQLFREESWIDALSSPTTDTVGHCNQSLGGGVRVFASFVNFVIVGQI